MPVCSSCGTEIEAGTEFYIPQAAPDRQLTALLVACPTCASKHPDRFRPPRGPG